MIAYYKFHELHTNLGTKLNELKLLEADIKEDETREGLSLPTKAFEERFISTLELAAKNDFLMHTLTRAINTKHQELKLKADEAAALNSTKNMNLIPYWIDNSYGQGFNGVSSDEINKQASNFGFKLRNERMHIIAQLDPEMQNAIWNDIIIKINNISQNFKWEISNNVTFTYACEIGKKTDDSRIKISKTHRGENMFLVEQTTILNIRKNNGTKILKQIFL